MKNFHFAMQKVLDVKGKKREKAEWEYAKSLQFINKEKDKIKEIYKDRDLYFQQLNIYQTNGTSITEIKQTQSYIDYLEKLIADQLERIKKLENSLSMQQQELKVLKIDEKKWTNLREKKYIEYLDERNQLEQKELDEIASQRVFR